MLFDQLKEPLDGALKGAQRMAELSQGLLNGIDDFQEELRRLRRDFPRLVERAMTAFHGEPHFAADLKHEIDCVQQDAFKMVAWTESTWAELRKLFAAIGTDGNAAVRYGQARDVALQLSQRHSQAVFASCNRAYLVANRICVESEKAAIAKANTTTEADDTGKEQQPKRKAKPQLSERENHILRALLMMKADNEKMRVSRIKAARRVDPGCKHTSYSKAIASLVKRKLIAASRGPGAGIWLTPQGIATVQTLAAPKEK